MYREIDCLAREDSFSRVASLFASSKCRSEESTLQKTFYAPFFLGGGFVLVEYREFMKYRSLERPRNELEEKFAAQAKR